MAKRRRGAAPKPKKPRALRVATGLNQDPLDNYNHCLASWTIVKGDKVHFPTPFLSAQQMDDDLQTLHDKLQAAESGGPVDEAALAAAAEKVRHNHVLLGKYVESVARTLPVEDGKVLIAAVLMSVNASGRRAPKPELAAKDGATSGLVKLIALAIAGAVAYTWESSLDQVSWVVGAHTAQASGSIAGLTPGKLYYFRFHALLRDNTTTNPSQVVSLIVR